MTLTLDTAPPPPNPAAAALAIPTTSRRVSEKHCPIFHEVVRFFDAPATTALTLVLADTAPGAL